MSDIANFISRPNKAILQIVAPLSTLGDAKNGLTALRLTSASDLPKTFTKWIDDGRIAEALDQADCGDCWAMSSTAALGDRFMIAKTISGLILNPLITATCATGNGSAGCNGGLPSAAGDFFETTGAVDIHDDGNCTTWQEFCKATKDAPHPKNCAKLPSCTDFAKCNYLYKAKKGSTKATPVTDSKGEVDVNQTIVNMKTELMMNGPLVACFFVPWDFFAAGLDEVGWKTTNGIFINGSYEDELKNHPRPKGMTGMWGDLVNENGNPAGHAVEIVGWSEGDAGGKYGTVPYWIIKNSWGNRWNGNGTFKYGIYDDKKNINTKLGMDIPIKFKGQLFGGCTQFLPDVTTGAPYGHETATGTSKKVTSILKKVALYGGVALVVLAIAWWIYMWYSNRNSTGVRDDLPDHPVRSLNPKNDPNNYYANPKTGIKIERQTDLAPRSRYPDEDPDEYRNVEYPRNPTGNSMFDQIDRRRNSSPPVFFNSPSPDEKEFVAPVGTYRNPVERYVATNPIEQKMD